MNDSNIALQLENVEKVYQTDKIETIALSDINLSVAKGEFLSIMGPSGSGKSTLLNVRGYWMRLRAVLCISTGKRKTDRVSA